jgi:hypothetical protein
MRRYFFYFWQRFLGLLLYSGQRCLSASLNVFNIFKLLNTCHECLVGADDIITIKEAIWRLLNHLLRCFLCRLKQLIQDTQVMLP